MQMQSGKQAVGVVHLQGMKDSHLTCGSTLCGLPQRRAWAPLSTRGPVGMPAVLYVVGHPVVQPIVPCIACLNQVDSLLPLEGFLTCTLVIHIDLLCSWEHHEVRSACLPAERQYLA